MKRTVLLALIGLLSAALVWMIFFWNPVKESPVSGRPMGGDFEFQSYAGPVTLDSLRGKVVILYFGYTWCPDICPTSLGLLSAALNELSAEELAQFQALFVSVDPDRDTLDRLKTYASYFHEKILGVTGSREQIDDAVRKYGAAYRIVKNEGSATGYVVDHSAELFLIDRHGKLVQAIRHGAPPEEILSAIKAELAKP